MSQSKLCAFVLRTADITEKNPKSVHARDCEHAAIKWNAIHGTNLAAADFIPFADFKLERDAVREIMRWNREERELDKAGKGIW